MPVAAMPLSSMGLRSHGLLRQAPWFGEDPTFRLQDWPLHEAQLSDRRCRSNCICAGTAAICISFMSAIRRSSIAITSIPPRSRSACASILPTYADDVIKRFAVAPNSLIVELGSNDGSLLGFFKERGMKVLGVDPAVDIAKRATANGIETIADFFTDAVGAEIRKPAAQPQW